MKRTISVAPMMDCTDRHDRFFLRLISKNVMLYSEMVATKSAIYGDQKKILSFSPEEKPLALQVGGSDKKELSEVAKIAEDIGYDEININLGCPSKKVQKNIFGACLMKDKILVRNCLESMIRSADIIVSIKCRIGIGKELNYDFFCDFIDEVIKSGINIVYVHARNAILNGLSPKNNRTIPPLNYDFVTKIKNEYAHIQFILNGGIESFEKAHNLSKIHDGVMVGRLIQNNPFSLLKVDKLFFNTKTEGVLYQKIILEYFQYIKQILGSDSIFRLLSPLLNIFFGISHNKKFKSEIHLKMKNQQIDILERLFLRFVNEQQIDINL